jgi:hypothetical protein
VLNVPRFYQGASKRLEQDLGGNYLYAEKHFGDQNLYLDELGKNVEHARAIASQGDLSLLRRKPPPTTSDPAAAIQPRLL